MSRWQPGIEIGHLVRFNVAPDHFHFKEESSQSVYSLCCLFDFMLQPSDVIMFEKLKRKNAVYFHKAITSTIGTLKITQYHIMFCSDISFHQFDCICTLSLQGSRFYQLFIVFDCHFTCIRTTVFFLSKNTKFAFTYLPNHILYVCSRAIITSQCSLFNGRIVGPKLSALGITEPTPFFAVLPHLQKKISGLTFTTN